MEKPSDQQDFHLDTRTMQTDLRLEQDGTEGFCVRMHSEKSYRMRVVHTVCVMWMFITLGWNVSMFGATFPDLRQIIDKDLETASWLFTSNTLGYMVGALVGGVLFDRFNRLPMLALVTVLGAASLTAIPWCNQFWLMLTINVFNGAFSGGIDVGGNSHIASLWGVEAAPFMQCIHFGFSVGGILSPFTADPFVAEKRCAETGNHSFTYNTSLLSAADITFSTMTAETTTACNETFAETHVQYAFLIAGVLSTTAAVPFLVLYFVSPDYETYTNTAHVDMTSGINADVESSSNGRFPHLSFGRRVLFVTVLMLLISMYASAEGRFSGFLQTFVTEYLNWTKTDGLHLNSLFWGSFAAGRFLGIFVSRILKPATMIGIYVIALTLSFGCMLFAAMYDVTELVWACTALTGLSMSVIYPCIFTWTAESIMVVTGTISAVYTVGVSVLNMLSPLLFGHLMDRYTQMYFTYLLVVQGVFCVVIYAIIRICVTMYIHPLLKLAKSGTADGDKK